MLRKGSTNQEPEPGILTFGSEAELIAFLGRRVELMEGGLRRRDASAQAVKEVLARRNAALTRIHQASSRA